MNRGRPKKYLTIVEWNHFLSNHWRTLSRDVLWLKWLIVGIFIAVIAGLIINSVGG